MNQLLQNAANFLCGMNVTAKFGDETEEKLGKKEIENGWEYVGDSIHGTVTAEEHDGTVVFFADFTSKKPLAFTEGINFGFTYEPTDEIVVSHLCPQEVFWNYYQFPKTVSEFKDDISNILIHRNDLHYSFTALVGEEFRTEFDKNGLHLSNMFRDIYTAKGSFLAITAANDPYVAVDKNYKNARLLGGIRVPLVESRPLPSLFREFGYCCWNTFYHDITSEGLYRKLDEFKAQNVPIKWMIIDDGWAQINEKEQLRALEEDHTKFPEGLKTFIDNVKKNYGIKYVGVWHTMNAWWFGVDPKSQLAEDFKDSLTWNPNSPFDPNDGILVPCDDPDKAYLFWDAWHGYLASCGVDFVKVDNQSNAFHYLRGVAPASSGTRHQHEAIERSIAKHFGGVVIDCMGMEEANQLTRPYSAVSRNSNDFYPELENGFTWHLTQNAYNAIWHSKIYHCDYDMWWSGVSAPVESGMLRAISGGPVYISDAMGVTNGDNVRPICDEDGKLSLLDHAGLPTYDEIYHNMTEEKRVFKMYNKYNDYVVLGLFNPCLEKVTETFSLNVNPDMKKGVEYIAYEYFTKKFSRVTTETKVTVSLEKSEVRCYSYFPIRKDENGEYILFGDATKYVPAATPVKTRMNLADIAF